MSLAELRGLGNGRKRGFTHNTSRSVTAMFRHLSGMRLRILLSCLFGFASAATQSIQLELPERIAVLELEVNDLVLALTPEQIPELIERASVEDVHAQCILGVAY